jgi:hypothetical protein
MFYATVFLLLGSSGKPVWSETVPQFREFHQRIWSAEAHFADNHMKPFTAGLIGNSCYTQMMHATARFGACEAVMASQPPILISS